MSRSSTGSEDSQSRSAIVPEADFEGNFTTPPRASVKKPEATPAIPAPIPSPPITLDDIRDRPTVPARR